jgi:hypothetical protein
MVLKKKAAEFAFTARRFIIRCSTKNLSLDLFLITSTIRVYKKLKKKLTFGKNRKRNTLKTTKKR